MPLPDVGDLHISAPLTNLSVAYIQDDTKFVAARVFPVVPVEKQFDLYYVYSREDFFRDEAELRGPGAETAGGGYRLQTAPYHCHVYGFHKDVSEQEYANADSILKPDDDAQAYVTQKLLIKRERLWVSRFFTGGVWAIDLDGVPSSPGAGQFLQWDQAASDPVEDIEAQKSAIALTGYEPNVLVLGRQVFAALKTNAAVLDRIKGGATRRDPAMVTRELLAQVFEVDEVLVASGVVNLAAAGAAPSYAFIAGKHALLAYRAPRPGLRTPSAGYHFAWTGLLGAGAYGNRIKKYWIDERAANRIEGEMAFDQKVVAPDLGAFFENAVA